MLSAEECELATHIPQTSRVFLEYADNTEGYGTEIFFVDVQDAAAIANFKYPMRIIYHNVIIWSEQLPSWLWRRCFDCQEDECPSMWSTAMYEWHYLGGKVQKMVDDNGVSKGMRRVLEERVSTQLGWVQMTWGLCWPITVIFRRRQRWRHVEPWLSGFVHSKVTLGAESHRACVGAG